MAPLSLYSTGEATIDWGMTFLWYLGMLYRRSPQRVRIKALGLELKVEGEDWRAEDPITSPSSHLYLKLPNTRGAGLNGPVNGEGC